MASYKPCRHCGEWYVIEAFPPKSTRCKWCGPEPKPSEPFFGFRWGGSEESTVSHAVPSRPMFPKEQNHGR